MDCRLLIDHLDAYVDGELEPSTVIDFEQHLDTCSGCCAELRLTRLLKQGVAERGAGPSAPGSLAVRVERVLDEVDADTRSRDRLGPSLYQAVAIAAAVLLFFGYSVNTDTAPGDEVDQASILPIFRDIVDRHVDALPAEIQPAKAEEATSWFRGKVGFRVRSVRFDEPRVRFMGARVSHVGNRRAAKLYYKVGGHRLTMVVFKSTPSLRRMLSSEAGASGLGARRVRVGGRVVTYRNVHDYTVPIIEHNGIAYAFTGDLDQEELLRLVASAHLP